MMYLNGDSYMYEDPDTGCCVIRSRDGLMVKITADGIYFIDKFGNIVSLEGCMDINARKLPTYEELYEYWSKTKEGVDYENTKN